MIKKFCFAAVVALLSVGCTSHFISDQEYRAKVEQDFAVREKIMVAYAKAVQMAFRSHND